MSNTVTRLCRPLRLPQAQKSVLMCLADYCHDDGRDRHGIVAITDWTCLSKRTVIDALQGLEARGLIAIERTRGKSNRTVLQLDQIKLHEVAEGTAKPCDSRTSADAAPVRGPHDTSAPDAPPPVQQPHQPVQEAHPKHQEASVEAPVKQTPKRASAPKGSHFLPDSDLPAWMPIDAWRAYVQHRDKMGKPMTEVAQALAIRTLLRWRDERGHDPRLALEQSVMNGWQGLVEPRSVTPVHGATGTSRHGGFQTKNYAQGVTEDGFIE